MANRSFVKWKVVLRKWSPVHPVCCLLVAAVYVEANRSALHGFDVVVLIAMRTLRIDCNWIPGNVRWWPNQAFVPAGTGYARSGMLIDVEKLAPAEVEALICERVGLGAI